jgi:hypothetical protein
VQCFVRKCYKASNRPLRQDGVFHRFEQFQFRYLHISEQNIATDWRTLGSERYLGIG